MPRLLTPYENTHNAARLNSSGQITRRQFEMLIDPEMVLTRGRLRQVRRVIASIAVGFLLWAALYWSGQGDGGGSSQLTVACGAALLIGCASILVYAVLRLLYSLFAITTTSEETADALRKRIRESALSIAQQQGRIKLHHLVLGRGAMLCSLEIGRREFPISQSLWEVLHERGRSGYWTVFYLLEPFALLSVIRQDELTTPPSVPLQESEFVVTGRTIARRQDLIPVAPRGESPQNDNPRHAP